jgi:hypothetical protein
VTPSVERLERICGASGSGSGIVVMATTAPCDVNVILWSVRRIGHRWFIERNEVQTVLPNGTEWPLTNTQLFAIRNKQQVNGHKGEIKDVTLERATKAQKGE